MSDGIDTCPVCNALVTVVGGETKHYVPMPLAIRIEQLKSINGELCEALEEGLGSLLTGRNKVSSGRLMQEALSKCKARNE